MRVLGLVGLGLVAAFILGAAYGRTVHRVAAHEAQHVAGQIEAAAKKL